MNVVKIILAFVFCRWIRLYAIPVWLAIIVGPGSSNWHTLLSKFLLSFSCDTVFFQLLILHWKYHFLCFANIKFLVIRCTTALPSFPPPVNLTGTKEWGFSNDATERRRKNHDIKLHNFLFPWLFNPHILSIFNLTGFDWQARHWVEESHYWGDVAWP